MDDSKILNRIKKLLRLSKSSNRHEAALALERARDMMLKYNIDEQTATSNIEECTGKRPVAQKVPTYMHLLAKMVANCFGCYIYYGVRYVGGNGFKAFPTFVGTEPNAEIALYSFDVLERQLNRDRKIFIQTVPKRVKRQNKTVRADYFCLGWIDEVEKKVFALVPKKEPGTEVMEHIENKGLESRPTRMKTRNNQTNLKGATEGRMAAKDVQLHKGAGFASVKQLQA